MKLNEDIHIQEELASGCPKCCHGCINIIEIKPNEFDFEQTRTLSVRCANCNKFGFTKEEPFPDKHEIIHEWNNRVRKYQRVSFNADQRRIERGDYSNSIPYGSGVGEPDRWNERGSEFEDVFYDIF